MLEPDGKIANIFQLIMSSFPRVVSFNILIVFNINKVPPYFTTNNTVSTSGAATARFLLSADLQPDQRDLSSHKNIPLSDKISTTHSYRQYLPIDQPQL